MSENLQNKYSPLLPDLPEKGWKYSLHTHKNKNGTHYDLMLTPPLHPLVYAWSSKTLPFKGTSVKAYRTPDKLEKAMSYDGVFYNKSGMNRKKLLALSNPTAVKLIDGGLTFTVPEGTFNLINVGGKKYKIEAVN